ncbi:hypothetical protein V6V89_31805 [Micromonospora sp. CPCC 206061]
MKYAVFGGAAGMWSSADMVTWTDHGSPMSLATFSWASADAWAGQAIHRNEFIAYSTAPGPTGPWTYRGTLMPRPGSSFTNHPGIVDFNGGSYFFYHSGALPGGGGYTRSVAVEKFTYNGNGTIPTINMTTTGAPQMVAVQQSGGLT